MKGKEFKIILGILLAVIAFNVFFRILPVILTGLVDYVTVNMQVLPDEEVCIDYLEVPDTVERFDNLVVNGVYWNCGSVESEPVIRISIMSGNDEISFNNVYSPVIEAGEKQPFIYQWNARNKGGNYTLRVRAYFNNMNDYNERNESFVIYELSEGVSEGAPAPSIEFIEPEASLRVEYPEYLNLTQDSDYTILIKATNVGDVPIHNISLSLLSEDLQVTIVNPEIVDVLESDSAIIFIVRATVPFNLSPGDYRMVWKISSNEIQKTGTINIEVSELTDKEKAKQMIEYYSGLIDTVQDEIDRVREIKNVTEAEILLNQAREEMSAAKDLNRLGLYRGAIEQLDVVRNKIEAASIALSKAEALKRDVITVMRAGPKLSCLIWLIILVVLTSVTAVILTLKTHMEWKKIVFIVACIGVLVLLISGFTCWLILLIAIIMVIAVYIVLKPWKRRFEFYKFRRW